MPVFRRQQSGDVDSLARDEKIVCEAVSPRAANHSSRKIIIHRTRGKQTVGYGDKNAPSRPRYCSDMLNIGNDRFLNFGRSRAMTNAPHLVAGKNKDQQRGRGEAHKKTVAE